VIGKRGNSMEEEHLKKQMEKAEMGNGLMEDE
jgi:hypothetical protein